MIQLEILKTNSNGDNNMRKNRKLLITILFLTIFVIANSIFNFILVPPGLTRVILHELESNNDYKCVILGTSHGSYGIDADIVSKQTGKKTLNLCIGGEYLQDSYYLLKQVFQTNHPEWLHRSHNGGRTNQALRAPSTSFP